MADTVNLGNVVGLIRSETAPDKTYVIWGHILDPEFPDIVVHKVYNGTAWVTIDTSAGTPMGDSIAGGTVGSVLFVGTGPVLAQDNANFNYNPGVNFTVNTPVFSSLNSSSPIFLLNDEIAYSGNPFAGSGYVDVNYSSYMGVVDTGGVPVANIEVNNLSTGAGSFVTVSESTVLILAGDGINTNTHYTTATSSTMYGNQHSLIAGVSDISYFAIPFAGSWATFGTRDVWNGVYEFGGVFSANMENSDTSTGDYSAITVSPNTISITATNGAGGVGNIANLGYQFYSDISNGTNSSLFNQLTTQFTHSINTATTDTTLTQTNQSLVFIPGITTSSVVFGIRNAGDTNDLFRLNGDGSFMFKNTAGGIVFQTRYDAGPGTTFALGDNALIANAGSTDVLIGNSSYFDTATGTGRIVIGYVAHSTAFYGITIGQAAYSSSDGGLAIGFAAQASGQGSQSWGMNMRSSATASIMMGTNYSYHQTNNIANSFMLQLGLATATGNFQDFFISGKSNVVLRNNTALTAGTHYETAATNTVTIHNGTNPTAVIADAVQISAKDTTDGLPKSTLALWLEAAPTADVTLVMTHHVRVWINNVEYYIALQAV